MKIGATADLHGYLPTVPNDLDLLLIAGDIGMREARHMESFPGFSHSAADFSEWVWKAGCPVIGVAGNHDFAWRGKEGEALARRIPWTYLLDETTEFEGLKIHGSPWTPTYGPWAFMKPDPVLSHHWDKIPDDVDILITHGPPRGVMDVGHGGKAAGSVTLRQRLAYLNPLLHIFGHIHGSRGIEYDADTITANVAYVDEAYLPLTIMEFDLASRART